MNNFNIILDSNESLFDASNESLFDSSNQSLVDSSNVILNNTLLSYINILTSNLDYYSNNLNTYDSITNNTFNRILNSSFYDEVKYKNIISDKGKETLKKINYTNNLKTNNTCPIYQTLFTEGIEIIKLPCNHSFIPEAIEKWLNEEKAECPVCRYKFDSKEIKNDNEESNRNQLFESLIRSYDYENLNWTRNTRQRVRNSYQINRQSVLEDNEEPILEDNEEPVLEDNEESVLEDNQEPILEENEEPVLEENEEPVLEENEEPVVEIALESLFNIINRSIREEDEFNLQEAIINSFNNE